MGLFDFLKPRNVSVIQEKQVNEEEPKMEEEIKCKDCGKKMEEDNQCYSCDESYCDDCLNECKECDEEFCQECFTDKDNHSCDVKFEVTISFKNTNDDLTIDCDIRKEANDTYTKIKEAIKAKQEYIEESNTFILVNEIKYVALRL